MRLLVAKGSSPQIGPFTELPLLFMASETGQDWPAWPPHSLPTHRFPTPKSPPAHKANIIHPTLPLPSPPHLQINLTLHRIPRLRRSPIFRLQIQCSRRQNLSPFGDIKTIHSVNGMAGDMAMLAGLEGGEERYYSDGVGLGLSAGCAAAPVYDFIPAVEDTVVDCNGCMSGENRLRGWCLRAGRGASRRRGRMW